MSNLKKVSVILSFTAVLGTASVVKADVIYTFTTVQAANNGTNSSITGTLPLSITFDLADSVSATSQFAINGTGTGATPRYTAAGVPATPKGLISVTISTGAGNSLQSQVISPTFLNGTINGYLNFNGTGLVSSTSLSFSSPVNSAVLTGTGVNASGFDGGSAGACVTDASSGICSINGVWSRTVTTAVPEPTTLALVGAGILGFAAMRRYRALRPRSLAV